MSRRRLVIIGATIAAIFGALFIGSGVSSALAVSPVDPGGVQVDLNHDETVGLANSHVPQMLGAAPQVLNLYDSHGGSYGDDLTILAHHSAEAPRGHLSLAFFGPVNAISWGMLAYAQ